VTAPQAPPFTVILIGFETGAPGGWHLPARARGGMTATDRGRGVPGGALGRQPAVRRRCTGGAASPAMLGVPRALAPVPAERAAHHFACRDTLSRAGSRADRRAAPLIEE
jgi:hypothetical protein